jgi:hypothetical protein
MKSDARVLIGLALSLLCFSCDEQDRPQPRFNHARFQVTVTPLVASLVTPYLASADTVINATVVGLPLTKKTFVDAKVLDLSTQQLSVDLASKQPVDAPALFHAEGLAYHKAYAGFSDTDYAQLDPKHNMVAVWVNTPSLKGAVAGSLAPTQLKAALANDKVALKGHIAALSDVTLLSDSPDQPIIVIDAGLPALQALAQHTSVGRFHLIKPRETVAYAPATVEQDNLYWWSLWFLGQAPISTDMRVSLLENCHPAVQLRTHDVSQNWMNYLPNVTLEQADNCLASSSDIAHASMTHSILYGHLDTLYPTARGSLGMLESLSTPVSSLAINGMDPSGRPTDVQLANALSAVLSRPVGSAPEVLSISTWIVAGQDCTPNADLAMKSLDWQTIHYSAKTLVVVGAGNAGYESPTDHSDWKCKSGAKGTTNGEGGLGAATCTDGIDNDGDGLVDCDDPDCNYPYEPAPRVHWYCGNRHYVFPKMLNAIVVGGYDSKGRTQGQDPGLDTIGDVVENKYNSLSSWRAPRYTHNDMRLPHVVAAARAVQAADYLHPVNPATPPHLYRWWAPYEQPSPPDDPNVTTPTGTSFAAPQVAGLAAYALRQALAEQPTTRIKAQQATRAMVMASARHNPLTWYYSGWGTPAGAGSAWISTWGSARSRLNTGNDVSKDPRYYRDGAGAVDAYALVKLLPSGTPGNRWWGSDDVHFPPGGEMPPSVKTPNRPWPVTPPTEGEGRYRFALAWHPYVNCTEPGSCNQWGRGFDFDVCMFKYVPGGTDELVGCSASWDNNYELIDTNMLKNGTAYYNRIYAFSGVPGEDVARGQSHYFDAYHDNIP